MTTPARITLSRAKGFNLQAASMALNGLPAISVSRGPNRKWGNPFSVEEFGLELAVWNFRQRSIALVAVNPTVFDPLRGKNLACWCKKGQPCHADVLIHLANRPTCEEVK